MSATPRVSVVIPTYNGADYLGAAIDSVLRQTYEDFEIVVVDNASTDHTPALLNRYRDRRFRHWRNESNIGMVGNFNRGLDLARGEFVVFLGSDDVWGPQFLQNTVAHLDSHDDQVMVHTRAVWIDEMGRDIGLMEDGWAERTPGPRALLHCFRYGFCFSAVLMRTALVRQAGGLSPAWKEISDCWLFLRLCLLGDVGYLAQPLVRYRLHKRTLSSALYRNGQLFIDELRLARQALAWPDARDRDVRRRTRLGLRYFAISTIRMLHVFRFEGSRRQFLWIFRHVIAAAPEVALYPSTWMRLTLGLLPRAAIMRLQNLKRRRWSQMSAAGVVSPSPS
jgi:glycosyltransferase involved in cell wall biosynthesis